MIVVTHKQGLFSKCESLVGVSRPKEMNLSQVYSLKLEEREN
jgi:chromosome segregation ATPase